jgi:hypothetical protein
MNRFMLSKCRTQLIDRILDLALAFEIAVGGESESWTAISWKVAVRTAQAIGGTLDWRRTVRRKVGQLYDLRSKATHGGSLALQLRFLWASESMGNHDSKIVDAGSVD